MIDFDNSQKRRPVRSKEPIRFSIQPMPSKVNFKIEVDENKDQALLGDFYDVLITMAPEDITITEMSLTIEGVEVESQVQLSEASIDNQNLMVSQMLDDSKVSTIPSSLNAS